MTTYEFYREIYGGTADEVSFLAAVTPAETILLALLHPVRPEDFSEEQREIFFRAVCIQTDYGMNNPVLRIRSESLGDRSVTYETEPDTGRMSVRGMTAAPQAVLLLENGGCLPGWV